jgi:hypothetical protein
MTSHGTTGEASLPHRWFVTVGSCSCGLRHLHHDSADLGFAEPVGWFPQAEEDLEATRHVIQAVRILRRGGARAR